MRLTLSQPSRGRRACIQVAEILERWWARYLIGPLLVSAPPIFLLNYARLPEIQGVAASLLPNWAGSLIPQNPSYLIFAAGVYTYACTVGYGFVQGCSRPREEISVRGLLTLLHTIEVVVGSKAARFESAVQDINSGRLDQNGIFLRITQPEQQIALLAQGILGFFDALEASDVGFKISVAEMKDGKPVAWFHHAPTSNPPRTQLSTLQRPESAICRAAKRKRLIVVEDFTVECQKAKKNRNYVDEEQDSPDPGSLISYPVILGKSGSVALVVTVVADKNGYFKKHKADLYRWILDRFVVRRQLECQLLELRGKTIAGGAS